MLTNILQGCYMPVYSLIQCLPIFCMAVPWQHTHRSNATKILHGCSMPIYSLIQCLPIFCMAFPWQHTHLCNATKIMHGCSITIYRLNCYWDCALIKAFIAFLTTWHAINPHYLFLLTHRTTGVHRVRFLKIGRKRRKDGWSSLKWRRLKCRK
jgi:hypothetical protein